MTLNTIEAAPLDAAKLEQFVFRAVDEVGATLNAALVVMGDRLGLYRALAGAGALTPGELAARTGTGERYVREWLNAQAAGGYVEYHPSEGRYSLPPEQTVALTDSRQPGLPARVLRDRARLACWTRRGSPTPSRSGAGVGWHEHNHHVHDGCERFFRPGYNANLIDVLAARARRRRRAARARRPRRRRRLRPRRLDDPDGRRVPELHVRRLRLPRRLDRDRAPARRRSRRRRPRPLRGHARRRVHRRRLRRS